MKLPLRLLFRLVAVLVMSVVVSGCGPDASYRYKLTLAVYTPEGLKRASSVVEVAFRDFSFPEQGTAHRLRGEALYLDLGPGATPLIALLTSQLHPRSEKDLKWTRDAGPDTRQMSRLYSIVPSKDFMDDVPRIAKVRGARHITPDMLPDLVTFSDVNNPSTVIEVDPNNLQAALGPNVTWSEITLESTDEPITTGLRTKLPWIERYFQQNLRLNGSVIGTRTGLANILGWFDFYLPSDLRRSR
jgi:hypothetical protein